MPRRYGSLIGGRDIAEVNPAALLAGGPPNRTLESVHSTVALAEHVNAVPGLSHRVLTADARETWGDIASGVYGSTLAADAITHLRKFGDRAMNDLKIEEAYAASKTRDAHRVLAAIRRGGNDDAANAASRIDRSKRCAR